MAGLAGAGRTSATPIITSMEVDQPPAELFSAGQACSLCAHSTRLSLGRTTKYKLNHESNVSLKNPRPILLELLRGECQLASIRLCSGSCVCSIGGM